jgi:uncharacterized circularly permuted ATP-grasp superfamily protein/uncharacterized alpha-E superfamily protein
MALSSTQIQILQPSLLGDLFRDQHQLPAAGFDELRQTDGPLRPHWKTFARHLPGVSSPDFWLRWREAQQLIRENGVTYNVSDDHEANLRPWRLDPLPVIIPQHEAEHLAKAVPQRARLFEAILADIYGDQRLLAEGLLPPEFVFANPGYLRPLHGIVPPNKRYLHLYAANLGRDDHGHWHLLRDRTQAPTGAGYALENRIVIARLLPEAFANCQVQRLASFYQALINTLRSIAHRNRDNPRIVLVSDARSEAYFEQAYLARYLGITLAEGGDLTVRDRQVYLKVLGGLQPVDVLFRRLEDMQCDPLELQHDSFDGITGLVQAVRAKTVAVANALGVAAVECPAMLPLLPKLCRTLLGEDLLLPSANTWWCGDPVQLNHVLEHPQGMILKAAFATRSIPTVLLDECTSEERATHLARLKANPSQYVAQQQLALSTVPVVTESKLEHRRFVLRTFLAADQDSFLMMPGGLACFGSTNDSRSMSMSKGGGSKDAWVLSDKPVDLFSRLPKNDAPVELTRAGGDLPSRSADNLFWLGRYAERAEGSARLLRSALARLSEQGDPNDHPEVPALLCAVVARSKEPQLQFQPGGVSLEADVYPLVFQVARPYSLASVVVAWHRVAGLLRDRISTDMWRVVGNVHRLYEVRNAPRSNGEVLDILDRTVMSLAAFGGLATESMTRGEGWRFLDLGRKLERSLSIITLMLATMVTPVQPESFVLDSILEVADARMTYRRRYLNQVRAEAVLDLVLLDDTNPRSLVSLLLDCNADVQALPRQGETARLSAEQRLILSSLSTIQLSNVDDLTAKTGHVRQKLSEVLIRVSDDLRKLSTVLSNHYLTHLQNPRHLASTG